MKKVALYGGSFDPPHLGHVLTVTAVLNSGIVDEIWLVPTGKHRDKTHHALAADRKAMIAIMMATMFGSRVPVYLYSGQVDMSWRVSTTVNLLKTVRKRYPDVEFYLIVGSDLVKTIPQWTNIEAFKKKGLFLVMPRLGADVNAEELPDYMQLVPVKEEALTNISSSMVRKMVMNDQSIEGIVPPAVISHILRNRMYKVTRRQHDDVDVVVQGEYISMMARDGWEYVTRSNCSGVVVIVGMTSDKKVILTTQYRIPVQARVLEFPAGLVNDIDDAEETHLEAGIREFEEETGYRAEKAEHLFGGPVSAGLTSERVDVIRVHNLTKVSEGGGKEDEDITVYEVPLTGIDLWIKDMEDKGYIVDPKVYAGIYYLTKDGNDC